MSVKKPVVFLVDDDPSILKTLPRYLEQHALSVHSYSSAKDFLSAYKGEHGCLVLDLSMPEMSGLELQAELEARAIDIPIIFITGHGGVSESVQAMRAGAIDFLEKPFLPDVLHDCIGEAIAKDRKNIDRKNKNENIRSRFLKMTDREYDVYRLLVTEAPAPSSKAIASSLGISHRTVEHHRARILEKTNCSSVPELRVLADEIGFSISDEPIAPVKE